MDELPPSPYSDADIAALCSDLRLDAVSSSKDLAHSLRVAAHLWERHHNAPTETMPFLVQKGVSVCEGMRGLKEEDAAFSILSGLKPRLMQDGAYADFAQNFKKRAKEDGKERLQLLKSQDKTIRELEAKIGNLIRAVEDGNAPTSLYERLTKLEADLADARTKREAITPEPYYSLPPDLPALYRGRIDDLVGTLADEGVSGRASDEHHKLIDTVVVSWDAEAKQHELELKGKLLELLHITKPAGEAGLGISESSLKIGCGREIWTLANFSSISERRR